MAESVIKPLALGGKIETEHTDSNKGVLGCFAVANGGDRDDGLKQGDVVLISAGHVLFPGRQLLPSIGVYENDHSTCCSSGDRIATAVVSKSGVDSKNAAIYNGSFNGASLSVHGNQSPKAQSSVNAAMAKIGPDIAVSNVWPDGTPLAGAAEELVGIGPSPE